MIRRIEDLGNQELEAVLQTLLEDDVDITAREVARRHSSLSAASAITRNSERKRLLQTYQIHQAERRRWSGRLKKQSKEHSAKLLAEREAKILALEKTVKIVIAGHISLISAVAQAGGMRQLAKFYENFRDVRSELHSIGALPAELGAPAIVTHIKKDPRTE